MAQKTQFSTADRLHCNPWNLMAPGAMQTLSLDATTTLPHHGQQNGAHLAQFGVPAPQNSEKAATMPQPETDAVEADATIAEAKREVSSDDLSDVQTSDGSESRILSESNDIDRQDKYAFNYSSQAYDHQVPQDLSGGITIFAEKVCMGTLIHQYLEKADKQGDADVCPTLVPHELEMQRNPKSVECVWVGMLPAVRQDGDEDDGAEAQPKDAPRTPSKGQKRVTKPQSLLDLADDQLDIIPHNPRAFRVVAKIQTKQVKTWHLYALTTSDTGSKLCQGWKVSNEDVFFFKAFRDDAVPGLIKRKQATELKIKAKIFPPAPSPAVVSQSSSTPTKHATSPASDPVTPTTSNPPSPEMGESSRTLRAATALSQKDDPAGISADNDEDDEGPIADTQSPAGGSEGPIAVGDDGSEEAFPEHALPSSDPTFKGFLDSMLRELSVAEPEGVNLGQKRKRVAFDTGGGEGANTRRKTGSGSQSDVQAQDGEDGVAGPSSFVIGEQTRHLARKLKNMVDKLVAKQDVSGLRQSVAMMECIQERRAPGPSSALAPYLSTSSKKDTDPQACKGKLREIRVSLASSLMAVKIRRN